jgi:hypothetical protein
MGYEKSVRVLLIFSKTRVKSQRTQNSKGKFAGHCCLFIAKLTPLAALHKTGVETIFDLK